jgi:putative transcriptional regulator
VERPRERAIGRVRSLLESSGFYVSDAHAIRPTSFDLLARRDSLLIIVKVLKNIDALDPREAKRFRELSFLFPAIPFVVGQTSGASELEVGVVYNRYGLPIISEATLEEYVGKGVPPFLVSSPGGVFAQIDGGRLRALRELHRLSLGALAGVAGVSRRTIQLYEDGGGAEMSVVERIEGYLGEPIARPVDLFAAVLDSEPAPGDARPGGRRVPRRPPTATGDPVRDGVFRQLGGMGWQVTVTIRCPFDAFSQAPSKGEEEILLTSVGSIKAAQQRAEVLQKLARVAEGHALFVVQELASPKPIDGLAVLTVRELRKHRDRGELLDAINEQEAA